MPLIPKRGLEMRGRLDSFVPRSQHLHQGFCSEEPPKPVKTWGVGPERAGNFCKADMLLHLQLWTFPETDPETQAPPKAKGLKPSIVSKSPHEYPAHPIPGQESETQRVLRRCDKLFQVHQHGLGTWKGDHLFKELNTGTGKGGPIHPSLQGFWWFASHFFRDIWIWGSNGFPIAGRSKSTFQENLYLHVPHILLKSSLESFYKNGPLFGIIPKYSFFFRPKVSIVAGKFGNLILTRFLCQISFLVNLKHILRFSVTSPRKSRNMSCKHQAGWNQMISPKDSWVKYTKKT